MDTLYILKQVEAGTLSAADAAQQLSGRFYEELNFAKIDHQREARTGCSETVFAQGKTPEQLLQIMEAMAKRGNALATRVSKEQAEYVRQGLPQMEYNSEARILTLLKTPIKQTGLVSIVTGGTADIPVAKEAAVTACFFGARVETIFDVGVAGVHRLLARVEEIRRANVIIAAAGMEGALASVVAGLVDKPVIALPTSVGYGASFEGLAPLLTMLNSCAEGIGVVNIDNGFGAGYLAAQINRLIEGGNAN